MKLGAMAPLPPRPPAPPPPPPPVVEVPSSYSRTSDIHHKKNIKVTIDDITYNYVKYNKCLHPTLKI